MPTPKDGLSHIACTDCLKGFVRDARWEQGWRPDDTAETFQRLYEAEKVVREQRAVLAVKDWETEDWAVALAKLHRVVMGGPLPPVERSET